MHLELNAPSIEAISNYAIASCRKFGIMDKETIDDVRQDAMVAAIMSLADYDPLKDRKRKGPAHRARWIGSKAARRSALAARNNLRRFQTNQEIL